MYVYDEAVYWRESPRWYERLISRVYVWMIRRATLRGDWVADYWPVPKGYTARMVVKTPIPGAADLTDRPVMSWTLVKEPDGR